MSDYINTNTPCISPTSRNEDTQDMAKINKVIKHYASLFYVWPWHHLGVVSSHSNRLLLTKTQSGPESAAGRVLPKSYIGMVYADKH